MAEKKEDRPWYKPLTDLADAILTPTPKVSGTRQSTAGPLGADATPEARRNPLKAVMAAPVSPEERIDPMGRRVGRAAPVENFWGTFVENINPIDYGVALAKSLSRPQDMLQVGGLISSWQRGSALWRRQAQAQEYKRRNPNVPDSRNPYRITDDWYTTFYRQTETPTATAGGEPVLVDLPGSDFTKRDKKTGKVTKDSAAIREQVLKDMYTAGIIANHYSSVDPSTGQRKLDWNAVQQTIAQNPIDAILAVTPLVEAAGVKTAAQLGNIFKATSAAGKAATATRMAAKATRTAVNPLGELAVPAMARAADIATTRTIGRQADVLNPEYVSAFSEFKRQGIDELVANGMSRREAARTVNDPANQDQIFLQFNRENDNRFLNPYNEETTRAMQATTVAPGGETTIDPTVLGLPSLQGTVSGMVSRRGGLSAPALREAVARASGAPSVTRSMTTGESPGYLWDVRGGEEGARQAALSAIDTGPEPGATIGAYRYEPSQGWVNRYSGAPADSAVTSYLNEQWGGRMPPLAQYGQEIAQAPYADPILKRSLGRRAFNQILPQLGGLAGAGLYLGGLPGAVTGMAIEGAKELGSAAVGAMGLRDRFGAPTRIEPSAWYAKSSSFMDRMRKPSPPMSLQLTAPGASVLSQATQETGGTPPPLMPPKPVQPPAQMQPQEREIAMPPVTPEYMPKPYADRMALPPTQELAPFIMPKEGLGAYGAPATAPQAGGELAPYVMSEEERKAYGGFRKGGRVAYKRGGKVNGVEPLVQSLMRKYKQARSMEGKSTEGLLDTPDQAIVKALSVAKKAI